MAGVGVALGDIQSHLAWQVWHLVSSTVTLCGRCGTYLIGLVLVAGLGPVLMPWTPRLFVWQARRLVTCSVMTRPFCVAGVAPMAHKTCRQTTCPHTTCPHTTCPHTQLTHTHTHNLPTHNLLTHNFGDTVTDLHFLWEAWRLWRWAGSGGGIGSDLTPRTPRLFVWQAWRLVTSSLIWRGRRGAW